jgi:hypothetical protein
MLLDGYLFSLLLFYGPTATGHNFLNLERKSKVDMVDEQIFLDFEVLITGHLMHLLLIKKRAI